MHHLHSPQVGLSKRSALMHGIAVGAIFNLTLLPMLEQPVHAGGSSSQTITVHTASYQQGTHSITGTTSEGGVFAAGVDAHHLGLELLFAEPGPLLAEGEREAWIIDSIDAVPDSEDRFAILGHIMSPVDDPLDVRVFTGELLLLQTIDAAEVARISATDNDVFAGNDFLEQLTLQDISVVGLEITSDGEALLIGVLTQLQHADNSVYRVFLPLIAGDSIDSLIFFADNFVSGLDLGEEGKGILLGNSRTSTQSGTGSASEATVSAKRWPRWRCALKAMECLGLIALAIAAIIGLFGMCATACGTIVTIPGALLCYACIKGLQIAIPGSIAAVILCWADYVDRCTSGSVAASVGTVEEVGVGITTK